MTDSSAEIAVAVVEGKADIDEFLNLPRRIHADDENWIAPLDMERRQHLSPAKNPYFDHAEAALFLARRDGRSVGRISAQIDRLHLDRHGDATGQFGFLDAIDDGDVFAALLDAAAGWLSERGMKRMRGPFSFSINQESGLLVAGFDTPPRVMMGHARPWYDDHVTACGLSPVKNLLAYDYDGGKPLPRAMRAMVDKARRSGNLAIRPLSKKNLKRDLAIIIDIFNDAWSHNWGFVPMTDAEIDHLGANLKILVREGFVAIAEWCGEPAAMAVTLPDINQWIADLDGRLIPFGWAKLAWRLLATAPQAVRMPLMGVRRQFQSSPIGSALALAVIAEVRDYHLARGTTRAELSWVLEDNLAMRRIIEGLGATAYKTYRIYERKL